MLPQPSSAAPIVGTQTEIAADDGQLLKRFIDVHDELAFQKLVEVHGSMVFGVCRRVIGNAHDADDAFQATFLVLARKARSMCGRRSIAGWLYEVAYRTALKLRTAAMRKKNREAPLPDDLEAQISESDKWSALRPLMDQELNRLPENYRVPLILCYLEGLSYTQAAARLGCPEGTLSVRLMRGKTKLAELLRRRGLILSVATLGTLLTASSSLAAVPPASLTTLTTQCAAAYATGQASLANLVSNEVAGLTNLMLNSMRLAKWASLAGTTAISTGLVAVALGGWHVAASAKPTADHNQMAPAAIEGPQQTEPSRPPTDRAQPDANDSNPNPSTSHTVNTPLADTRWGTIRGRVIVDQPIPALPPLVRKANAAIKDGSVCAADDIPDESFVVDPQSKGLMNVVIWLAKKPATTHPDLAESKEKEILFDQKNCRFIPHVLSVRTDQQVRVRSSDPIAHNTHTFTIKNSQHNFIVEPDSASGVLISQTVSERLPVKVVCDIHPWMQSWWVILDHPYVAVTNDQGDFEIANLPTGEHEFRVWQERIGYIEKSYKVDVRAGETQLESIVVPTASLR